jgi:hypothetical protein
MMKNNGIKKMTGISRESRKVARFGSSFAWAARCNNIRASIPLR